MKTFLFFVLLAVHSIASFSQDIRFGIKGGLNLSDIVLTNYFDRDGEASYKMKAGEHAGVFAALDVTSDFGLTMEVLYSNKGTNAGSKINLRYINLPILVQYKFSEKFLAEVGPEVGYLFSARSKLGNVAHIWDSKIDIGLAIGVQYLITEKLSAGARYYAGFSSVQEPIPNRDINGDPGETIKFQNRVVQFFIGYTIFNAGL